MRSQALDAGGMAYFHRTMTGTHCRFELHQRRGRDPFALRIGVEVRIIDGNELRGVTGYCCDAKAFGDATVASPIIARRLHCAIVRKLTRMVSRAERWDDEPAIRIYHTYYLATPAAHRVGSTLFHDRNEVTVLPTRWYHHGPVTAIMIGSDGSSEADTKASAFEKLSEWLDLATLVIGQAIPMWTGKWPARHRLPRRIQTIGDVGNGVGVLYPETASIPPFEAFRLWDLVPVAWRAVNTLASGDRERYVRALLAYRAAVDSESASPTQASVAVVAALAALGSTYRQRCAGDVRCTSCGLLGRHEVVGERKAIVALCKEELALDARESYYKEMKECLFRVHGHQRSGYVHDAQLRHAEVQGLGRLPLSLPGSHGAAREELIVFQDLTYVLDLTRWTMLAWLSRRSAGQRLIPFGHDSLPRRRAELRTSEGSVRADRWSQIFPPRPDEADAAK